MTGRAIIVDGVSGYAGSNFVNLQLRLGATVVALHRGAPERVLASINAAEVGDAFPDPVPTDRLTLQSFDLHTPALGVGDLGARLDRGRRWEYWHFAASLQFMGVDASLLQAVNVDGTRHAMDWFGSAFADNPFVHVSTIYTCGVADEVCREVWHPRPAQFRNHYESSKWAAEEVVRERLGSSAPGGVVRLPGLIGSSLTGRCRARTGVYGLLERLFRLSVAAPGATIRIPVAPDLTETLLPIDIATGWCVDLPIDKFSGLTDPVVQIVPKRSTPVLALFEAINEALPISLVATSPEVPLSDLSDIETVVHAGLAFVEGYMQFPASGFDRTNLMALGVAEAPPLDCASISLMVTTFVEHLRAIRAARAPAQRRAAKDGSSLTMLSPTASAVGGFHAKSTD